MIWDDILPLDIKEGDIITLLNSDGIYLHAEIVKIICPVCLERFIGNKTAAGNFISGHQIYHHYIDEQAEYYGGI